MEKQEVLKAIKEIREKPKRKFKQTFDLIINLHHLDIKKNNIDSYISLNHAPKKIKTTIFIDKTLEPKAKSLFDNVILKEDFSKYTKKQIKEMISEYDYFVSQANLMTQVAAAFGKYLGPKGKMPNPKAGCIISTEVSLQPLSDKLKKLVRIITKNEPIIKTIIGNEEMKDEDISENFFTIYNQLLNQLPEKANNIKSVYLKLSMGPIYKIGKGFKNDKSSKLEKK